VRVGLVCPYSLTLPGGVQDQVLGLARALRAGGVAARVLGPCDGTPPAAWVTPLGVSVPTAANGSVAPIAPDPAAALRTLRALRDEAFDVVHLHEPLVPGPTWAALASCEAPMVGTFHRSGVYALSRVVGPVARWAADRLAVRVAVSPEAEATARHSLGGSYELLWNGVDFRAYADATPWPRPPDASAVVFFVGRHEPRKGLTVLLDAFPELGEALPGVQLWVAGEGPQTARLRHATAGDPRIRWLGSISDQEKRRRLRAADALCVPSLHGESFGVVLLEGMAAGTCVVASDLPGYRNVARPGEALFFAPGDAAGLVQVLGQALDPTFDAGAVRKAASARADEFSMEKLAARYHRLYQRARSAGGSRRSTRRWF
jgi:phosphatidylinositol alpha-mannosyltransferase